MKLVQQQVITKQQYNDALLDGRWKAMRYEILKRDQFMCQHHNCGRRGCRLYVHSTSYHENVWPWQIPMSQFITLCYTCHTRLYKEKIANKTYLKQKAAHKLNAKPSIWTEGKGLQPKANLNSVSECITEELFDSRIRAY